MTRIRTTKRNVLCTGHITALRQATKDTRKAFRIIDAENQKIDQMELFSTNNKLGNNENAKISKRRSML